MFNNKLSATHIIKILQSHGYIALLCGGCVRDEMLNRTPKDYDVVTNALPEEVMDVFNEDYAADFSGKCFGVVRVLGCEIATFRRDGIYSDGRRPDNVNLITSDIVEKCVKIDSERRDFTINAIYFDPIKNKYYDPQDGAKDITKRVVRFCGNPKERVKEDHLRILRAIRFMANGFYLSQEAREAIFNNAYLLKHVSPERLKEEFDKIWLNSIFSMSHILTEMKNLNIFYQTIPEIMSMVDSQQNPAWHPEGDVFTHTCLVMNELHFMDGVNAFWAALLHDVGKPCTLTVENGVYRNHNHSKKSAEIAISIMERLKFSNKDIEEISTAIKLHNDCHSAHLMTDKAIRKKFLKLDKDTFKLLMILHYADANGRGDGVDKSNNVEFLEGKLKEFETDPQPSKRKDCARLITGNTLINLGVAPGPIFSEILDDMEEAQQEGVITEALIAIIYLLGYLNKHHIPYDKEFVFAP